MGKSRKWGRCILSFVLAAGMSSASIPVYAAPLDGGSGSDESNAKLPEIQTVTSIDHLPVSGVILHFQVFLYTTFS